MRVVVRARCAFDLHASVAKAWRRIESDSGSEALRDQTFRFGVGAFRKADSKKNFEAKKAGRELPCKPDSVRPDLTRVADDHFSGTGVASGLERPTRKAWTGSTSCTFPIWSFSGWGLPCQPCHQDRGAL